MGDNIKSAFIKGAFVKNTLLMVTVLAVLTACNNRVDEASRLPPVTPPPVPGVSVDLDADLQELLARDGQVTVQLSQDGNEAQALTIGGATATLVFPSEDMQGEHQYYIGVYYTSANITEAVLVAEGGKPARGVLASKQTFPDLPI